MIIDEKINIGNGCCLTANYISGMQPDVAIEYTEYSTDHWHSDTETSIDIDKNKAIEIAEFLKKHFDV
ncbi:MAG: hypothetical protein HOO93_01250 [Methyloglobulus sp.]|nr:hypothetical protein [Methyloglobulus sp.]